MSRDINVVVLGSEGMLGSDLIELFRYEEDIHVRGYSRRECDITSSQDIFDTLGGTEGSITHVINCAAYTDVDGCESNPELAHKTNTEAIKNLSEICLKEKIHFTHISTDYVFEGLKKEPYLEQDEAIPLSIYGKTKLAGEGFVRAMGGKGLVIRTAWLYGKHGKNFIDTVLNKLDLAVPVKVIDDLIGCPTYTMDLANTIIQLTLSYKSGIFHVVNTGFCSWYQFACKAAEFMKYNKNLIIPIKSAELNRKAERPRYSALSTIRLERTLPEPLRKWEDALNQYLIETKRLYEF
jgi:dTDP-4-dehydrorhamnose reductase